LFCTGKDILFQVPRNVSKIYVNMWGGGGAGFEGFGGAGAYVEGMLPVTPGSFFTVIVGCGGLTGVLSHPDTKRALFFEGSKKVFGSCPYVVRLFTSYLY